MEGYPGSIAEKLKRKGYKSMPVRMVYIPKAGGGIRPLGILTIKDTIVQIGGEATY